MNHVSYLDPPFAACAARPRLIWFLARKTLWKNKLFGAAISALHSIPVDQDRPDMTSLKTIIKLLKQDKPVILFPEGQRALDGKLQEGQPGIGLVVAKSRKPVLPMRIFGAFEAWPRNGKIRRHPVAVVIGDPVDFTPMIDSFNGEDRALYQQISVKIIEEIGKLALPDST